MNSGSNKMDSNLTGMWVNFFTAAGIPSDVSATYALTFTENRIQNDMLLDLNKEYLRDMGITRMGDVIAILRHAKQVHENTARDRVLSTQQAGKVPVAAVTGRTTTTQPKSSSPASRMLEHYTRNPTAPETSPTQKRKTTDTGNDSIVDVKKTRLIRFAGTSQVTPSKVTPNKLPVFSRLGNTEVSKVTSQNTEKPIFARLGAKSSAATTNQQIPLQKDALKYEGILKSTLQMRKVFTVTTSKNNVRKIACTMRADESPVSVKDKLALPKTKSVKFSNQVEYKEIESNENEANLQKKLTPVFNIPGRRLTMPESTSGNSIKDRLGIKRSNSLTITTNVFKRLGV